MRTLTRADCLAIRRYTQQILAARQEYAIRQDEIERDEARGCGTRNGWLRHKARAEYPCMDCVDAHRTYYREYRRAQRANGKAS